tara:strand:+ start:379 stop:708 length:330 start_codon:yes stop_codon:yes gene_type:complete
MFTLQIISKDKVFVTEITLDGNSNIESIKSTSLDLSLVDLLIEDASVVGDSIVAKFIAIKSKDVDWKPASETIIYNSEDRAWRIVGEDVSIYRNFKKILTYGRNLKVML